MKGDRELCTAAVTQAGSALDFVSNELKSDREFVLTVAQLFQRQGKGPFMLLNGGISDEMIVEVQAAGIREFKTSTQ